MQPSERESQRVPEAVLLRLWGKADDSDPQAYHPLLFHMLDVAATCEALLPRFGAPLSLAPEWVLYLAGLHDIGKADPLFQNKDPRQAGRLRGAGIDLPANVWPFR